MSLFLLKDNIYFKDKLFERNVEKNINFSSISSAIIYANGVASFCVEKFGVENMLEINKNELEERINFIKNHNI